MSSKAARLVGRRAAGPCVGNPCKTPLFRSDIGIAAGASGRRDYRCVAGIGRRRMHLRIDACGRAQHTVGPRQFVAERLAGFPGCRALRGHRAISGRGRHRRAFTGVRGRWRGGLCRRRRRQWRRLGAGRAGCRRQHATEKERVFRSHTGKTASRRGGSARADHKSQDLR
jgi:hypothetical protein